MPDRTFAFLRAINVGGNTVKMDRLRRIFTDLGLRGVETFIASGNVIFESPATDPAALEATIEAALEAALGFPSTTFLRTGPELAAIATHAPFPAAARAAPDATLFVGFLRAPPSREAIRALHALDGPVDRVRVDGREAYWLRTGPGTASAFSGAVLEKTVRGPATLRNLNTVRRLLAKYGVAPG